MLNLRFIYVYLLPTTQDLPFRNKVAKQIIKLSCLIFDNLLKPKEINS